MQTVSLAVTILKLPKCSLYVEDVSPLQKEFSSFYKNYERYSSDAVIGCRDPEDLQEAYKLRMKETYDYSHPKLNVSSKDFFSGDGVDYIYEHDDIHDAIALLDKPAFRYYMSDAEVMTSKDKFFSVDESIRLLGVYEETCVLALERSQIPNDFSLAPERSFMLALIKVCSSITSGWFREYAWENFFKVVELYHRLGENDYITRFKEKQDQCRLYGGKE